LRSKPPETKSAEEIRAELAERISAGELDAYLIVPENYADENARYEFFSRKSGDFIVNETLKERSTPPFVRSVWRMPISARKIAGFEPQNQLADKIG
jgi:hypothetical protein